MANYKNSYQYETSPRKLQPEYNPPQKEKLKKQNQKQIADYQVKKQKKKMQKKKKVKCVLGIAVVFAVLFAFSYRNAQISESYTKLKNQEKELSMLQKENNQLKVAIENNLNLGDLEQKAKEQLGMQKATTKQTRYVNLPKKDYVEVASEQINLNNNENILERVYQFVTNQKQ